MTSNNIKVSIKVRPLIQREKNDNLPSLWSLIDENTIKSNNKEYKLSFGKYFKYYQRDIWSDFTKTSFSMGKINNWKKKSQDHFIKHSVLYFFKDHIFDENRKTEEIFNIVAKPIVENAVKGINGTIFAYGQTSSGKVKQKTIAWHSCAYNLKVYFFFFRPIAWWELKKSLELFHWP